MASSKADRNRIIDILVKAFQENKSVNYIVRQDEKRLVRTRLLMEYAYFMCYNYGHVYLSEDKNACALVLFPHVKKTSLKGLYWDAKLVLKVMGIFNLLKVLKREGLIKKHHPKDPFYYLWFIGVDPLVQGQGLGSALMQQLVNEAESLELPFYLETSTLKNLSWYQKFGFQIYHELEIGYRLLFLRHIP